MIVTESAGSEIACTVPASLGNVSVSRDGGVRAAVLAAEE